MSASARPPVVVTTLGSGPASGPASRPPRRGVGWVFLALLLLPIVEVGVLIATGRVIGLWWTLGLLVVMSALGAWLVKREGRSSWRRLGDAVRAGRAPTTQASDAAIVFLGGALLLLPGIVSDVVALFLLLPVTRPVARRALQRSVERRVARTTGVLHATIRDRGFGPGGVSEQPIVLPHMDLRPER